MEFDWIPKWWGVITTGVAILATIVMLWLSKTFARREELKEVSNTMDELTSRMTSLESRVDNMPTQEQLYELGIKLERLNGDINALAAQLKPANHQISLLLEQRLNEK
ncbi:DUF2730 family protein [Aeromonas taiwanensis]|uniref:DUF2730 family protein n=1 Tax=Aeromonas rivipollensis TaxID=948519 RepID=UPI0038CFA967